jgi:hypothetical protein
MNVGDSAPLVPPDVAHTYNETMTDKSDIPERPRAEPEIIPPNRTNRAPDWRQRTWQPDGSAWVGGTQRIYVGRIGPFGLALLILMIGVLAAVILLTVVGAVLLWIPVLVLLVAAGALYRLLRR